MAETDRYAIGLEYEMSVELTPLVPKDEQNKPIVSDKVYLDGMSLSYIDSGTIDVLITNRKSGREELRSVRSDYGMALGELLIGTTLPLSKVYTETGRRRLFPRGRVEDIQVKIKSATHLGVRIAAISQGGLVTVR